MTSAGGISAFLKYFELATYRNQIIPHKIFNYLNNLNFVWILTKSENFSMKIPWEINHVFNSPIWHVVILEEISYVRNWKMEFFGFVTRSIMMDTEIRR
jgi:hypothetical protein